MKVDDGEQPRTADPPDLRIHGIAMRISESKVDHPVRAARKGVSRTQVRPKDGRADLSVVAHWGAVGLAATRTRTEPLLFGIRWETLVSSATVACCARQSRTVSLSSCFSSGMFHDPSLSSPSRRHLQRHPMRSNQSRFRPLVVEYLFGTTHRTYYLRWAPLSSVRHKADSRI